MAQTRRALLSAAAAAGLSPVLARAMSIDAKVETGTVADVAHVVILMQENRGFDHYFGALPGVNGFADRFPIPLPDHAGARRRSVWAQARAPAAPGPALVAPFALETTREFRLMRAQGAPHNWSDTQFAWDHGRMAAWPSVKGDPSMGAFGPQDLPFQTALAELFTVCDAYHCSFLGGTNTNRVFLWSGTNDPAGAAGGPVVSNVNDTLPPVGRPQAYGWTTYVERLQGAGVSWRIYQDMADNFSDNPLVGFRRFRDSHAGAPGADPALAERGMTTRRLDALRADVLAGRLPQVSYIVAGARESEHPEPSSPAQGADYIARAIAALTADPAVWARTALFVMYDENDGFFDHVPPPAPPSLDAQGRPLGASTVDTAADYHRQLKNLDKAEERPDLIGRPYGLGPRVPMFVVSPWSRGGWVNSQLFDHTSIIKFLELRFGVAEPNISPWRRAVCGDLTSAFDFRSPNRAAFVPRLPTTAASAQRAAALPDRTRPPTPQRLEAPVQPHGVRPSRPLPYRLAVSASVAPQAVRLAFANPGRAGAVFHVYDRLRLDGPPRRYTVEAGRSLEDAWPLAPGAAAYDLWVLGPHGFHRHFAGGAAPGVEVRLREDAPASRLVLTLSAAGPADAHLTHNAYGGAARQIHVPAGRAVDVAIGLKASRGWYDITVTDPARPGHLRRFAGRLETGRPSITDPARGGPARLTWT